VAVPGIPLSNLVVVQAHLAFGLREAFFYLTQVAPYKH
jgi:hypothetical protein